MSDFRAYPRDLAVRVRAAWPDCGDPLPPCTERVLDTAYHASFLRDEERPVTCRILVAPPSDVGGDGGPPDRLLPLVFREPRPFDEHEIRRLSPAAKYHRALLGVAPAGDRIETWGIVQSGPRWLQHVHGGRGTEPPMPACLVVRIVRPGHIVASCGTRLVAELRGGEVNDFTVDVFSSAWLPGMFAAEREQLFAERQANESDRERITTRARVIAQAMIKRVVATMRATHHGGTLLILPQGCAAEAYLTTKYTFGDAPPRRHFRQLLHEIIGALDGASSKARTDLEDGLFEMSHLIAALADVDGAVVLTRRFEILGFSAEISGDLPSVSSVRRALDLEGQRTAVESVDGVGTRHRSAYRLCAAVRGALAIVVSQDGGARFITQREEGVIYWDHNAGDG
jgi:hypothetical protein